MINNFRRNGLDSLLISGALLILLTPLFVIVADKVYTDLVERIFYVLMNCFFWFMVSLAITQFLYEKYLKEIDGLVILNPQRMLVIITGVLLFAYYLFFNMTIAYSVRSPGFFAPVLILFAPLVNIITNRVGIGKNILIYGFYTINLDSISEYRKEILKNKVYKIIIRLSDGRRLEIRHSGEVIDRLELHIAKHLSKYKTFKEN